jgi:hypothetical protein
MRPLPWEPYASSRADELLVGVTALRDLTVDTLYISLSNHAGFTMQVFFALVDDPAQIPNLGELAFQLLNAIDLSTTSWTANALPGVDSVIPAGKTGVYWLRPNKKYRFLMTEPEPPTAAFAPMTSNGDMRILHPAQVQNHDLTFVQPIVAMATDIMISYTPVCSSACGPTTLSVREEPWEAVSNDRANELLVPITALRDLAVDTLYMTLSNHEGFIMQVFFALVDDASQITSLSESAFELLNTIDMSTTSWTANALPGVDSVIPAGKTGVYWLRPNKGSRFLVWQPDTPTAAFAPMTSNGDMRILHPAPVENRDLTFVQPIIATTTDIKVGYSPTCSVLPTASVRGCPYNSGEPNAVCLDPATDTAAIRCCNDADVCDSFGPSASDFEIAYGEAATLTQAQATCALFGYRLCTQAQIASRICCGTGAQHDSRQVWTLDSC